MKERKIIALIFSILIIIIASCEKDEVSVNQNNGVIFTDNFDSENEDTTSMVEWRDNTIEKAETPNGTMGLKFVFGPDSIDEDSWREQRFHFSDNYPEIWIKYDLYVPKNFHHRCPVKYTLEEPEQEMAVGDTIYRCQQDGSIQSVDNDAWGIVYKISSDSIWVDKLREYYMLLDGDYMINKRTSHISQVKKRYGFGANNKFILLWQGDYGSTSTGNMIDLEYWPVDRGNSVLSRYLSVDKGAKLRDEGHIHSEGHIIDKDEDTGKWMELIFHFKIASAADNDGIIHIQKNGQDYLNVRDIGNYSEEGFNYLEHGYLLGWSNSGFGEETIMYIDNVVFSVNPIKSSR
jgi:hypothetical protein